MVHKGFYTGHDKFEMPMSHSSGDSNRSSKVCAWNWRRMNWRYKSVNPECPDAM